MGGSVLVPGRIELLVHRRVNGDEARGVFEHLIENAHGNKPIHVKTGFAVQIFNRMVERSLQREF